MTGQSGSSFALPVGGANQPFVTDAAGQLGFNPLSSGQLLLSGNVATPAAAAFTNIFTQSLPAGTWLLDVDLLSTNIAGAADIVGRVWDGSTVYRSGQVAIAGASFSVVLSLSVRVVLAVTTSVLIDASCKDVSGRILAATLTNPQGNNATSMRWLKVG